MNKTATTSTSTFTTPAIAKATKIKAAAAIQGAKAARAARVAQAAQAQLDATARETAGETGVAATRTTVSAAAVPPLVTAAVHGVTQDVAPAVTGVQGVSRSVTPGYGA